MRRGRGRDRRCLSARLERDYAREAAAANTRRAYRAAWQDFTTLCEETGRPPLPASPETVGTFLATRASSHKAASLNLRLVAIRQAHRLAGHRLEVDHPAIRETMKGIRRTHGTAVVKKEAAVSATVRDAVDRLAQVPGLRALRDRALLLVGFAAALRRSELVALDVADLRFVPEGVVLTLQRAKTDQEGAGAEIAIPYRRFMALPQQRCQPAMARRRPLFGRHGGLAARQSKLSA